MGWEDSGQACDIQSSSIKCEIGGHRSRSDAGYGLEKMGGFFILGFMA